MRIKLEKKKKIVLREGDKISNKKRLTPAQQQYKKFAQDREPKKSVLYNCFKAFIVGGTICTIWCMFKLNGRIGSCFPNG